MFILVFVVRDSEVICALAVCNNLCLSLLVTLCECVFVFVVVAALEHATSRVGHNYDIHHVQPCR